MFNLNYLSLILWLLIQNFDVTLTNGRIYEEDIFTAVKGIYEQCIGGYACVAMIAGTCFTNMLLWLLYTLLYQSKMKYF